MHRALRIFIAVIFLTASFPVPTVSAVGVAAPYPVQTDPNYHVTWDYEYGGGFQHIAQDGEEIFFLRGPYLVHQRIIVPTHLGDPVEIWHSERINSKVLDLAVYGSYAYLALDDGGMLVYSTYSGAPLAGIWIETPELPHLIVGAGTLYAHTTNNVLVYSLSQPTAPQVIADLPYPEGVNDIAWDSSQLAVGLNTGLTILNVLDPASPQWQEHYPSTAIRELTSGSNRIYAVTTDNTFDLYLLASGIGLKFVSHYQLPVYVSFLRILSAIGDAFYVYTQDDYGASGIGPSIYRAQVPLAPTLDFVSHLDFPNSAPDMVIGGTFGVAISHDRLVVYDFPSPDYPVLQSQQFAIDFEGRDADFNDSETDLYVANNKDGIARISVPTLGAMAQVARQATPGIALGIAHHAGYVYVADDTAGARIYNENLALQSVIPFQGAMDVALSGNYLYVANSEVFEDGYVSGVYVYNITNPSAPVLVSTLPIEADMSRKLEIQGNYLYLSGSKLHVIDISNPASPQDVAQLTTVGKNYGMTVSGNLLFLTHTYGVNFRGGFSVIDITNPLLPQQLAYEEMTGTHVGEVVYKAPYLYFRVGDFQTGTSGLFIYDVSIPAAPCEAGYYRSDFGWGLAINQIGETPHIYLFEGGIVKVLGLNMPAGPYTIAGSVTTSGGGLPNALVSVGPGRTSLTNAEGNYSITNLPACRYSVAPQKNRYSFSPNKQGVDPSLFDTSSVNFSATLTTPYQISGLVRNASDQPLSGVTITDGTGPSVTTGADGSYTLTGLEPGQHTLTPTYPDMTFIPTSLIVTLDDLDLEGQNFIGSAGNFNLSGIINSDGGFPVEGVTVTDGAGRTTLTGEDGRYSFEGLPPGAYTITPTKTGYGFSPAFLSVTLNTASAAGQNFTGLRSAPTALQLSKNTLAEHQLVGTPIGRLTTSDPNEGDTFTYQFVDSDPACDGSDNSRFLLEWASADVMELRANQIFDHELDNSFNICIRSIDSTYRSIQQSFTISIYDLPEKEPHLLWNTFNRGGNVRNMVTDAQGNIYVTGSTTRGWGVPVSPYTGGEEIYVGKYLPDGTLAWNTFFGHGYPGYDRATGIFLKPNGNLIILGYSSNHWGSPVPNPTGGTNDTVVFELDASGNLLWHTYIGGNMGMRSEDLQVDGAGNIYFTAYSQYDWGAPINPHNGTNTDIAVVKLSPTGSLLWNTFVGGDGQDDSKSLRLDESGNLYTIGYSFGTPNGSFLYMLDNQGNLLSSRPLGGGNFLRLEVDSDAFYIYGNGCAPNHHTPGISSYSGVAKYSLAGEMQWCTHLGGGVTFNYDAVLDKARNRIHLAGLSEGTWGEPAIAYAGGINDAQISTLDMETGDILFYTFLGGLNEDRAESIEVDPSGNLLIGGYSKATWGAPINAFTGEDAVNAWVAKLSLDTVAPTGIGLSKTSVFYKVPVNTVVGQFTASDPDASGPYTYTLVSGEGAENNGAFTISGDQLLTAQVFDPITQPATLSIRVRVTDGTGLVYETPITITIQSSYDCQSVAEIPEVECKALVALYQSTGGENWNPPPYPGDRTYWLLNDLPCSWYGVTCSDGHVTSLQLANYRLAGPLPPELGDLGYVQSLDLSGNRLNGSLPIELGQLDQLKVLALYMNELTGAIPAEFGSLSALQTLDLDSNALTGSIPIELGNLSNLQTLSLSHNSLTGSIPTSLGNLAALKILNLRVNNLSGSIPVELGNLSNLQTLSLSYNGLTGSIPTSLGNLSELTSMSMVVNQLSGPIPTEFGQLAKLQYLLLDSNQLSGSIPTELGNLTQLKYLTLSYNQLTGSIPSSLGNLTQMVYFNQSVNQLSGQIPPELGQMTQANIFNIASNQLTGTIPVELGNLTSVTSFNLSSNQLSGAIPSSLGNFTQVHDFSLANNQLSGSIPPELGNLKMVNDFSLANNQLSGNIPPQLSGMTYVHHLSLANNQLSGNIPPELGTMRMSMLYLNNNPLVGIIPIQLTNITYLSSFWYNDTYLCEPTDPVFTTWLSRIGDLHRRDLMCVPSDIQLSPAIIAENQVAGATVGHLATTHGDINATFSYILSGGVGAEDNSSFSITGDTLITAQELDYEAKAVYNVRVQVTDNSGQIFSEDLTVNVTDVNEAPAAISLSNQSIQVNQPSGTLVGLFTTTDPDSGDSVSYQLVNGDGGENNSDFVISGNQLLSAVIFDYESTPVLHVRVRATDSGGLTYETPFTITIQRSYDCQSVTEIPEVECRALEALYNSTYGSNWIQQDNWLVNNSTCSWYGVTCLNNHVSSIELGNNNLGGTIPAELGNLSALTHLTLTSNQIGGSIPPELGQLSSLVYLDLRDNQINGSIPAQLGSLSHLEWLNLSENFVTGNIPPELGNLSQLDMLSLAYSQITGSIPPEIGNLVRLRYLRLGYNPISGSIPPEVGNMTNLSEIYLRGTLINGQLPSQLNALPNLTSLDVAYTQLSGPAFIIDGLSGFWFEGTSMCEPDEPAFSAWKAQVESWGTTGTICPDTRVYTVSGSVTDLATNTPLAGVTISDGQGHTATTGADGQLTLTGLLAGNYTFTASKTGYLFTPPSITVTVGGGSSVVLNFTGQALNPVPVLGSVEPGSHQVDGTPLELTINGIGFVPGSVLRWNGTSVPTQYFSSSLLRATIDTSAIHQDQTASLVIYSPGPGGGVSNTISFTVYLPKTPEVQPMLLCVTETGANTYTATFNYTNLAKRVVSIPSGENNYFSPAPTFRGQPVTFQVDTPAAGFSVDFDGQSLTWHLDGLLVTASSASPRCAAPEPDPFSLSKVSPDHAKFGPQNDINIHGEGLQAGTNVYLLNACPVPLDQVPPSAVKMVGQFMNDKHIRATVPGAKPVGSYAILAANPDGALACLANAYSIWPDDKHDFYADAGDFWSSPAVLRANSKADLGLVLHRFNGGGPASDVIIRFYLGEKDAGGQLIGETQVDLIEKNNAKASPTVTWAVPAETGAYTLYAYIDPDNHFADELDKNNNIIRRQVVVETSPQDTTPPEVVSFTSKDGWYVSQTSVSLQVDARDTGPDPVSGVQSIYLYEYEYNQPAAEWVQVQASGWIDLPKSGAFRWDLIPTPGLHYLKVWASDRAGNISALPGSLLLNYQPGKGKLAQGLLHLYRQELTAGETLRLDLTSTTGDADIYLWGPDNTLVASSLLTSTLESITYQAVKGGMYQIEVFGYSSTDYELEITRSAPVLLALPAFAGAAPLVLTAGKALPAAPVIALNNVPPDQAVLPYPERKYNVFMPSVWK